MKFDSIAEADARYHISFYDTMPSFYGKHLSASLQEAVDSQLSLAVEDQLNLFEELALVRKFTCNALDIYKTAEEGGKAGDILAASKYVSIALDQVATFCEKAAKVDSMQRDKYSIHTINSIVAQIVSIAYTVLDLDAQRPDLAQAFEEAVRVHLKIPVQTIKLVDTQATNFIGTNLTPDKTDLSVMEMDGTIPSKE